MVLMEEGIGTFVGFLSLVPEPEDPLNTNPCDLI